MKRKKLLIIALAILVMAVFCFTGCGGEGGSDSQEPEVNEYGLANGTYVVDEEGRTYVKQADSLSNSKYSDELNSAIQNLRGLFIY